MPSIAGGYQAKGSAGFRQVTQDMFGKMTPQDQLKYLHQYIQTYKPNDPSLLQAFSRFAQQPAKKV